MMIRVKKRAFVVAVLLAGLFLILLIRIAWLQLIAADELVERASGKADNYYQIPAERGTIYDRKGRPIALDVSAYTVAVNPKAIADKKAATAVVDKLAPILGISKETLRQSVIKQRKGKYLSQVELRKGGWKISKQTADQVHKVIAQLRTELKDRYFNGVLVLDDTKRHYPGGRQAAHITGHLEKNGVARGGLESFYNKYLTGEDGSYQYFRFNDRRHENSGKVNFVAPKKGLSVRSTIDRDIQDIVERAVNDSYQKFLPKSMTVIVADPNTMEILAMTNRPNFNPNEYWNISKDQSELFNHAVSTVFEPGSTQKIITLAAGIEEGKFNPNEMYESGSIEVGGRRIHDHNRKGWKNITYLEGLMRSSNVAFINLGYHKLTPPVMESYIHKFGFGTRTRIDLPSENGGKVTLEHPTDFAGITYGHGRFYVSPIQQVAAVSSVANGGRLLKPYLVSEIIDEEQRKVVQSFQPKLVSRTISEETSRKTSLYLEETVKNKIGTGYKARIDGYRIAGKTGTTKKVVNGFYSSSHLILSFIGYAPVEKPRFLVAIMVDEPDFIKANAASSDVAPPLFRTIAKDLFSYMNIPSSMAPKSEPQKSLIVSTHVPDIHQLPKKRAVEELKSRRLEPVILGAGDTVLSQFPTAGEELLLDDKVYLLTEEKRTLALPDMTGYTVRDVNRLCSLLNKTCRLNGSGFAVLDQRVIEAEQEVAIIQFEPQAVTAQRQKDANRSKQQETAMIQE